VNDLRVSDYRVWHESGGLPIADGVDFTASKGSILGLVGPNGSGKTTLLRALAGLHKGASGSVRLAEHPLRGKDITFLSQNYRSTFLPWASLRKHLALNIEGRGLGLWSRGSQIDAAVATMEVEVDLSLRPDRASGGMLQQVNLVLAAARKSPVIFADEPFSALDITVASRLRRNFRKWIIDGERIGVVVLHDPVEILELCDRVLLIPDKPFATSNAPSNCHLAEIIERNVDGAGHLSGSADGSFVAAMKRAIDA